MESVAATAWLGLARERERLEAFDMRAAALSDPGRSTRYRLQAAGLTLDYSRNRVDDAALDALFALARACGTETRLREQFGSAPVNLTEGRAALHTVLRGTDAGTVLPQTAEVRAMRERMAGIAQRIRSGEWTGWSGKRISAVVNIGIGGSHLGPYLVADALSHLLPQGLSLRFVSNVDPRDLEDTLQTLDPATTLFVISSKTFGTLETLQNASAAREWLLAAGCPAPALTCHLAAVSANVARAVEFGLDEANVLPMWDWVGGRFSLWSSIGLPLAIGLGMDAFEALLLGAHRMDTHALEAPLEANMPVLLALMEAPGIIAGVVLARSGGAAGASVFREVGANKGIVLLTGGILIGWTVGSEGYAPLKPLFSNLFRGILALYLLELGLVVGGRFADLRRAGLRLVIFAVMTPLVMGATGVVLGSWLLGLSAGGAILFGVLLGSASYIAAPAAMRMAVPEANPALGISAALAVTFPFNVFINIPLLVLLGGMI